MADGLAQHTYKIAFMDISKGANQRVVISDLDGTLRKPTEEELVHRSWRRGDLKKNDRLLRMKL